MCLVDYTIYDINCVLRFSEKYKFTIIHDVKINSTSYFNVQLRRKGFIHLSELGTKLVGNGGRPPTKVAPPVGVCMHKGRVLMSRGVAIYQSVR